MKHTECFVSSKYAQKPPEMLKDVIHNSVNSISVFSLYRNINKKMSTLNKAFLSYLPKPSQTNCPYFFNRSVMYNYAFAHRIQQPTMNPKFSQCFGPIITLCQDK